MDMDASQAYIQIISALEYLDRDSTESEQLINWLYTTDSRLGTYLEDLKVFLNLNKPTKKQKQEAGYLLEKILVLAFMGLRGYSEIKNFQSASHQYDLLISGDNAEWDIICDRLYLRDTKIISSIVALLPRQKRQQILSLVLSLLVCVIL